MVPVLRLLIHVPSSTSLSQPVALELVGANSLHQDELPASQNGAAKEAQRQLVELRESARSHTSMGFLFLPGYEGIHHSQPVASLSRATTIESFLQKRKTQAPCPFTYPPALTHDPPHVLNVGLPRTAGERYLIALGTLALPVLCELLYDISWILGCRCNVSGDTRESSCCPRLYNHSEEGNPLTSPTGASKHCDLHNIADQCLLLPL